MHDLLLGAGDVAVLDAPYSFVVPRRFILIASAVAQPSLRIAPGFIRGQRQGTFWVRNIGNEAIAVPKGFPLIEFTLLPEQWFTIEEVTL